MYFIPLNDSTEARYAEIVRKMLETGNWITPMQDYGVPFWAKPPLSMWLSAISMKLLGINEFAARLPSLFLSLGILWLVFNLAKKHSGSIVAITALIVLASSVDFILDAGAVMTDPSLIFCTTLSMIAFWHSVVERDRAWRYVFFIGLGLGLLAKGPIAIVLTGLPLFFWIFIHKKWHDVWQNLPWIKGTLIAILIALPWYLLAEMRTPGFLNYFIIGEHLGRFLISGWQGNKYGLAHFSPYGMIWIYSILGIFPWTGFVFVWLARHAKKLPAFSKDSDGWVSYWLIVMLAPLVFFTFAKNIIWPYVFPVLPAFALLFAEFYKRTCLSETVKSWLVSIAGTSGFIFLVATALFIFEPQHVVKSQKPVIAAWRKQHPVPGSNLIYWANNYTFSAQFYSGGKVSATLNKDHLYKLLTNNLENYIVIDSKEPLLIPNELLPHLTKINSISIQTRNFTLYRSEPINFKAN